MSIQMNMTDQNWQSWVWQQSQALRSFSDLKEKLTWIEGDIEKTAEHFQFQVTPYYFSLIDPNDPKDPIAKICIPSMKELIWQKEELVDPIGDKTKNEDMENRPTPALVHRYADRCLLFLTPLCSSYCRYCFRRELVSKPENNFNNNEIESSLQYIQNTKELKEVILSGGDPLTVSDGKLKSILQFLDQVPHVRTLRIHTRFPVFNPFRITDELIDVLSHLQKPVWMMVHVTHPKEITAEFKTSMKRLHKAGVGLLNQSVLIKGCNDDVSILKELSYGLAECGIVPQYIHTVDLAQGTSHFRVPLTKAQQLIKDLRGQLSGFLIPQLMLDIPGGYGKISLDESFIKESFLESGKKVFLIESTHIKGKVIRYEEPTTTD